MTRPDNERDEKPADEESRAKPQPQPQTGGGYRIPRLNRRPFEPDVYAVNIEAWCQWNDTLWRQGWIAR
ncbi:hypothetical protein [Actinoplanes sp. NPDC026623]|uniref:hypothetical protein n=1 Tax=Actinoplanes sp. NPDC026623 TaxID=3155610 RepID=UPI0033ED30E3